MNLQQLETFLQVARLGSLSQAAKRLNTTQSTVSMRLSELERELGVELLDRRHRPRRLTPKGRDLFTYAEEIVALTAQIRYRVGNPAELSGSVRVGVAEHVALTWLPDLVAMLNRLHPEVVVELEIGLLAAMTRQLLAGELDVLLTAVLGSLESNVTSRSLGSVQFVWMANPELGLPESTLSPKDLAAWPLVTMSRPSVLHRVMEDWFEASGALPRRVDVCNSLSACVGLTRAGLGVGLLPREFHRDDRRAGRLVEFPVAPPLDPIPFYAMHASRTPPPLARVVADLAVAASSFK